MMQSPNTHQFEQVYVIANYGAADKMIATAKKLGVQDATVLMGKGTASNPLLKLLDLCDIRKEIISMLLERSMAFDVMKHLSEQYHFEKPNHGITFSIPTVAKCDGQNGYVEAFAPSKEEKQTMYQAVYIIVDRGRAEDAIEVASKAGARGGTIIHARGAGVNETSTLFAMEIEPEKEIALIITDRESTQAIVDSVVDALEISKAGNGIVFVQDVSNAYGLFDK